MGRFKFLCLSLAYACAVAAPYALAQQTVSAADIERFELTLDLMDRYLRAHENMAAAARIDPSLLDRFDEDPGAFDLHEESKVERVHAHMETFGSQPAIRTAIEGADLTIRDFALVTETLIPAYAAYLLRQEGIDPGTLEAELGSQHIEFVARNAAEVERFFNRFEQLYAD